MRARSEGSAQIHVQQEIYFRAVRAWSTCSSESIFVWSITSEISQMSSLLAFESVPDSPSVNDLVSLNSVSEETTSARSKGEPDVNSFKLSLARCFQLSAALVLFFS